MGFQAFQAVFSLGLEGFSGILEVLLDGNVLASKAALASKVASKGQQDITKLGGGVQTASLAGICSPGPRETE